MEKSELDQEITDDELEEQDDQTESSDDESFFDGQVPQGLESQYKNMQRAFTKKTQQLADERKTLEMQLEILQQKADAYDNLARDPEAAIEVLQNMTGRRSGTRRTQTQDDEDDFSDFGDSAESMRRLVDVITKRIERSQSQQLDPLLRNFESSSREKDMLSLSNWVEKESKRTGFDLPKPEKYEPTIRHFMESKGMTAQEAYRAALKFDDFVVRPSAEKKKKAQPSPPGGGNRGAVPKMKITTEDAIKRRKEGKRGGYTLEELDAMYDKGEL